MPNGVAPAVVLDPGNAALMAAKILGLSSEKIRANVEALLKRSRDRWCVDAARSITKTYLSAIQMMRESDKLITERVLR